MVRETVSRSVSIFLGSILAIHLAACGKIADGKGGGGGGGGQVSSCQARGGELIPASGSTPELCRIERDLSAWFFSPWMVYGVPPRLTPSNSSFASGTDPSVNLVRHDKVVWHGTGRWDNATSSGCDNFRNLDGFVGSSLYTNEGVGQGFMARVGSQSVLLGSQRTWEVQTSGTLLIGFNTPDLRNGCWQISAYTFKALHCEDSAGTAFVCPE